MTRSGARGFGPMALGGLALVGAGYHLYGYYFLLVHPQGAWDLRLRWLEQLCVFAGLNPFTVSEDFHAGRPVPEPFRSFAGDLMVDYPPWAYFAGLLLYAPPWPAARILFAALCLAATAFVLVQAHRTGRPGGARAAWTLLVAVLAISSHFNNLAAGNYAIVVTGLLVMALVLLDHGHDLAAGALIGVAMVKPTIAGPFVLPLLVTGNVAALAGCAAYLAGASAVTWGLTGTDPVTMLVQMLQHGERFVAEAYGPLNFLLLLSVPPRVAIPATAGVAALAGWIALRALRDAPRLTQFAVAALIGRLWTYHKVYDNVMLAFVLLVLGQAWLVRRARGAGLVFGAVALSLWLPGRLVAYADRFPASWWMQGAHVLVWIVALAYIVATATPGEAGDIDPARPSPS